MDIENAAFPKKLIADLQTRENLGTTVSLTKFILPPPNVFLLRWGKKFFLTD
jgi:hypothetical protein